MKSEHRLFLYNSLLREKEEFKPINGNAVKMFVCGQTVYDDAHIGHAKTYVNFDIIARWLRRLGYDLTYIQNITDVEDKIIARAKERKEDSLETARFYENRLIEDMKVLGVAESVNRYPRSRDFIEPIRLQIQILIDKKYAYESNGSVYYEVSRFKDYTKLSGIDLDKLERHRIEMDENKKSPFDFALWKSAKPGEPSWRINLVINKKNKELEGRPGWHIEDTAMTFELFGQQYDIHGGANELMFPHHTNEIAQAEAASGKKPFVKYWLHSGVLTIKGEKMSKSLKNFITIRELLKRHSAESIRLMIASTHYRKEIAYSDSIMKEAEKRLNYFRSSLNIFYNIQEGASEADAFVDDIVKRLENDFYAAMNDDFNTPLALMVLGNAITELRKCAEGNESVEKGIKYNALTVVSDFGEIIGILKGDSYKEKMPKEATRLISKRNELRAQGNFEEADKIREILKNKHHVIIEDTEFGTVWFKK